MIRQPTANDHLLLLAAVLMFSMSVVSVRSLVDDVNIVWIITSRVAIALVVLLPWAIWRGFTFPAGLAQWGKVIALAFFNVILPFSLFTWGLNYISAGETSLILGGVPLFGLIVSHFSTKDDRFSLMKLIAVCFGFAGIATLFGFKALSGNPQTLLAYGAILLTALCYALSGGIIRQIHGIPPVRLTALVYLIALPVFAFAALFYGGPPPLSIPAVSVAHLVFLGLFPSGLGYILRYVLIQAIGYSYFALAMNLLPVSGILLAAIILGEAVTWSMIAALALILTGLAYARLGSTAPKPA